MSHVYPKYAEYPNPIAMVFNRHNFQVLDVGGSGCGCGHDLTGGC